MIMRARSEAQPLVIDRPNVVDLYIGYWEIIITLEPDVWELSRRQCPSIVR